MEIGGYIGAYRLEQPIGEGGMGAVWKARHPTLDRPVALKLIRSEVQASPQAREAFLREVRVLSRLHGPQIVQVTDFGFTETGDPYMVTEFLEGEDLLARVRRRGPIAPEEAAHIGIEVLKALSEAHLVGLVHRDLKPGNVFLQKLAGGARTAVKVLDFGVAKLLEGDEEDTLWPGARLKGSPRYMSPEQVRGDAITPASDIYAFGAMMYRVLTGKPVFAGDRNAVLRAHLGEAPPPMNGRAPGLAIPEELEDIVQGCLEKAPGDRPGSAGALQARMERLARRLQDARSRPDDAAPGGLALDWTGTTMAGDDGGEAGASGSLPVLAPGGDGGGNGGQGDLGSWFRNTGDLPEPAEPSDGWGVDARPVDPHAPTDGWSLDLNGVARSGAREGAPSDAVGPDAASAMEAGWGVSPPVGGPADPDATAVSEPGAPGAAQPDPDTTGLELDLGKARAPSIGGSMAGVGVPTGGLELETAAEDGGLELAFDPETRGGAPAERPPVETPEPAATAEPRSEGDAAPADAPSLGETPALSRSPARPAPPIRAAVERPWHEAHRLPLIAGGTVLVLLILVWIGRSAFIDGVSEPIDAAVIAAEPRIFDLGTVPVALDRGLPMLEAPSVARGPAAHNGAPTAEQRPTVLIHPDPPPATFTRLDTDEVICTEAATCRVPIDVDVEITRKGFRRLVLQGDDLYDRRGSTWRVILRR